MELGARHGRDALCFAREGFTVRATDFSATGLEQLRAAVHRVVVEGSVRRLLLARFAGADLLVIGAIGATGISDRSSAWQDKRCCIMPTARWRWSRSSKAADRETNRLSSTPSPQATPRHSRVDIRYAADRLRSVPEAEWYSGFSESAHRMRNLSAVREGSTQVPAV